MTVEVQLQVEDLDIRNAEVQDLLDEHLADYAWAEMSGITTMTVFSDGNVVADVIQAARCAAHHGVKVARVYEDRVTYGDIARRIGAHTTYSREAVNQWTQKPGFPAPRTASGNARGTSRMWDWAAVVAWLKNVKGIDLDEDLPTEKQVAEINAALAGVTDYKSEHWAKTLHPATDQPLKADFFFGTAVKASLRLATGETITVSTEEHFRVDERRPVSA